MKEIIFITKQGTKIRRKDNQIVLTENNHKTWAFPINRIGKLFIFGNIEISMPAINFLLSKNSDIYLLNLNGKFKGIITNTKLSSNYNLRLKQYEILRNPKKSLILAKFFVEEKIKGIEKLMGQDLKYYKDSLKHAKNYNEILGIEGSVSNLFFNFLKEILIDKNLGFQKREYRPSNDPVNATLSLVYSLFYSFIYSYLTAKGFDPYIGYLHKKRGTHAVLASDVMEIFRPKLSIIVIDMFNNKVLSKQDFNTTNKGCYFKEESLKNFLKIFHKSFIDNDNYKKDLENAITKLIKKLEI